ncbi:MAG: VWA domain-containing protein [Burkholderiaceae bacterium]
MRLVAVGFVYVALTTVPAFAQDVGIQFEKMTIGTTLVTQSLGDDASVKSQEFIGQQGDFYVVKERRIDTDGASRPLGNTYYDLKGREVKADWHDGPAYYTPYSCMYAVGACEQSLDYPNPLTKKKVKRTVTVRKYVNRLEGNKLTVTWQLANGKTHEVPFELGPYNFRVSSRYKNALGQLRGHKLIELIDPTSAETSTQPRPVNEVKAALESGASGCDVIYARLKENAPGDASVCKVKLGKPKFQTCKLPEEASANRPASHVVLILDASGSMAGKTGGKTKMQIAKKEALSFLNALQEDVPVGLMVYGHRGNNKESGRTESCAAVEWAHEVGASKGALARSINGLQPTGWTPLAGVLDFAGAELSKLPRVKDDKFSVPVVYLLSDGKETCGGDAVTQARSLQQSGIRATINVIGFDVDAETRAELEAISLAGGGSYFPADDAAALRRQLRAIQEVEASRRRYNYCQLLNLGQIHSVYHNAGVELAGCFGREAKTKGIYAMLKQIKSLESTDGPEKACVPELKRRAFAEHGEMNRIFVEETKVLRSAQEKGLADFYADSRFKPLEN